MLQYVPGFCNVTRLNRFRFCAACLAKDDLPRGRQRVDPEAASKQGGGTQLLNIDAILQKKAKTYVDGGYNPKGNPKNTTTAATLTG